jgi:ATP-binding cassette subfamily C protein
MSAKASDVVGSYGSMSKILRLLLQSLILGVGAYLVIKAEMSAGSMIAASIMMGRALAPIDMAIANWRSFVAARQSIGRLSAMLAVAPPAAGGTALPKPQHSLQVDQVAVVAPGATTPILRDIRFQLGVGEALGVIGPSGAGKTSLVRALVGIWPPARGLVRIDGAALDQWDRTALGAHIGFVSQAIDLFDGTVARNIARMAPEPDSEAVLRAARAAGVHEMILRLPQGYDTPVGEAASALSAGQRQRIALARALYGDPFFVVLDEPYSNLDLEGETAVTQAVQNAKARGAIVILVAHRPSALAACDKVLLLVNGTQQAFGARDEILQKIMPRPVAPPASLKVVSDTGSAGE